MRKIQKILIGLFFGGVLLGGVGTGIALVEYSSFAYAGETKIGEENLVTRDFDYKFDPAKGKIAVKCGWWEYEQYGSSVETDEAVPEGTIRYAITYNDKTTQPYLVYDESPEAEEVTMEDSEEGQEKQQEETKELIQGHLDVGIRNMVNDFALWMECKDTVLRDLKQRRIASYDVAYITDIKIKVNPETMPYVLDETR